MQPFERTATFFLSMKKNIEYLSINFLHNFLCFSEKGEQKLDFIRLFTKTYLLLSFNLNLKRIIELKRRDFFKLPVAKKVLSEKKMSRVVVNFATFQKDCNLFLVHEKEH